MKNPFEDSTPRWRQSLLKLTRIITVEIRRRCMCIPSRDEAKEEERRIRKEYGSTVAAVKISKNGKGPTATYTCAYTLRETKTEELF
ncbi:MAG: hypothetical protein QM813_01290 [Verrucomicrobiota bacterium]